VLPPRAAEVITDGLEFQFRFDYALPAAAALQLRAQFLPALPAPQVAPLAVTDENGNLLGSALLSPGKEAAEFPLPASVFPAVPAASASADPAAPTARSAVSAPAGARPRPGFGEFFRLGVTHILTGYDHLLFLGALLLGCRRLKVMLLVITGFTVAHSLTLALAALDVVGIPSRIVEPLIAASIVFVAADNLRGVEDNRFRWLLTCGFGLVHGFAFAATLRETALAARGVELAAPLLAFNLGVEAGQLAVAAVLVPLLFALRKWPWFERPGLRAAMGRAGREYVERDYGWDLVEARTSAFLQELSRS